MRQSRGSDAGMVGFGRDTDAGVGMGSGVSVVAGAGFVSDVAVWSTRRQRAKARSMRL